MTKTTYHPLLRLWWRMKLQAWALRHARRNAKAARIEAAAFRQLVGDVVIEKVGQ